MSTDNYTVAFTVDQTPDEVFAAVNNVREWWSGDIDGRTDELGAVFTYRYEDLHRSTQTITESVPGKRVVWRVSDSYLGFVKDKTEWDGTEVIFDIERTGDQTEVRFTHVGLVPDYECFDDCSNAWGFYITGSLRNLITAGTGQPNPETDRTVRSAALAGAEPGARR